MCSLHLNNGSCHVKQPHPPSMPNKKLYPTPLASRMSSFIGIVVYLWECQVDVGECWEFTKEKKKIQRHKQAKQSKIQAKPNKQRIRWSPTSRWRASSSSCLSSLVMSLWCSCDKQLRILPSSSSPEHSCWVFIGNKNSFKLWACLHAYDHRLGFPTKLFKIQAFLHACYYCLDCHKTLQDRSFLAFLLACLLLVCLQASFLVKCPSPAWTSIPIS